MNHCITRDRSSKLAALLTAAVLSLTAGAARAADEAEGAPRGPAVTVLKAAKYCFNNNVEISGMVLAREETSVRPEKLGAKVAEIMADAGDTVTAGQVLARITPPEGGSITVQAPVAGLISQSSAQIGGMVGAKGEALFSIVNRSEYDLVGLVPVKDIAKLQVGQAARIKIIGAGDVDARVRRIAPTIEPNSQLGQVFIGITPARRFLINSSGRALIKTGQSCGIAVPLTSILYGSAGTVVQVIRRAPRRDAPRRDRADGRGPGRDQGRAGGRRHRRRPRRRAAARRRSGAPGDDGGGDEVSHCRRPATRLRQGFAGVELLGRRSFSEGGTRTHTKMPGKNPGMTQSTISF